MKTLIVIEIENFLGQYKVTRAALAKEAGISPVLINRLLKGIRRDTTSRNADALRAAMHRLATPGPSSERGEEDGSMSASQQGSSSLSHGGDCQQPSQREQSSSSQGQPVTV